MFEISQTFYQKIEINGVGRVEVILVLHGHYVLLWRRDFVERVLSCSFSEFRGMAVWKEGVEFTMDKMTTHGTFKEETISTANEVFPEPEPPAMPMMLVLAQGGE